MFDPYHKWLGIPPEQRPPTHYQLLGISAQEQDREVIREAGIRQTAHLRVYQKGAHAAECSRLLNEIAQALMVLLDPVKRQAYDARLTRTALLPRPRESFAAAPRSIAKLPVGRRPLTHRPWIIGAIVGVIVLVAAGGLLAALLLALLLLPREHADPSAQAQATPHQDPGPQGDPE